MFRIIVDRSIVHVVREIRTKQYKIDVNILVVAGAPVGIPFISVSAWDGHVGAGANEDPDKQSGYLAAMNHLAFPSD